MIVEVEFASEASAMEFVAPPIFGLEVTDDKAFKNQSLACYGAPEINELPSHDHDAVVRDVSG